MIDLLLAKQISCIVVRAARADERALLEELRGRATLANPDDRQAIRNNPQVIDLPLEQILSGSVLVALANVNRLGFGVVLASDLIVKKVGTRCMAICCGMIDKST
jgi:hypothetical protein